MSNSGKRARRLPVAVALAGLLLAVAVAALGAASAEAANYKMVACAGSSGAPPYVTGTNTAGAQNPGGIFEFHVWCNGQGGDPPGEKAFMRIAENQPGGNAGYGAYGHFVFDTPPYVHFRTAGGHTRQFNSFNEGWRARFWVASASSTAQIMTQGTGLPNANGHWASTGTFGPHLWPISGYWDFTRFVYEMQCVRAAGCDRSNYNATDLNGLVFILSDDVNSHVEFRDLGSDLMRGEWVRGTHNASFNVSELGSGIRHERLRLDGAQVWGWDHGAECNTSSSPYNGQWARTYQPCPTGGPWARSVALHTSTIADGAHSVQVCSQDYAQYQGLGGTGGESCVARTIRTDNTAPGKPAGLEVTSANPERYLDRFGARFSLPPNQGSPIRKVHYEVINGAGAVVQAKRTLSVNNPSTIGGLEGPKAPGAYRLRVRLEDEVGHVGAAASAPIPRDTKPPAAPQALRVAGSTERWVERFDLRWRNVVDSGSPIDAVGYRVLDAAGKVAVAARTVTGKGVEALEGVHSPPRRGSYTAEVWLTDEEGNVGAPAAVPLPRDTTPPAAPQLLSVAAPGSSRAAEGFDVRWRNLTDDGSPIAAAHYEVLSAGGAIVVPSTTVAATNIEAIGGLNAPRDRGAHTLRLRLSDAEGNLGAPASVPLSYRCVGSTATGGAALTSGFGQASRRAVVGQGRGAALRGRLLAASGTGLADASVCVFGRVLTDAAPEFLGMALSGPGGRYRFALPAGPSRELTVAYRAGHRELASTARLLTRVRPTFAVRRKVVRNKGFARFQGRIPGPHHDRVVVVLQVKRGKGWLAFRRYRTRRGGRFSVGYRFSRTTRPTLYEMRAQVRSQGGYPYLQGTSKTLRLIVLPARGRR